MTPSITIDDVYAIAGSVNSELTVAQAQQILRLYPAAQIADPSATWDLVVENLIASEIAE